VTSLGESRVQELLRKREQWPPDMEVQWRLIGHLQRNKARKAVEMVDSVDSVDSIELAELLSRVMESRRTVLPVLLEVNTSGEASKHGVPPEEALPLLETILEGCPHIRPEGFMTIGPLGGDEREVRRAFALLRSVAEEARERFSMPLKELSMGMSGDFQWGIEEGSTMVRVGTALFGPRP
jgi:pyridoxal phosphate enzyme (YggS family)